MSQTQATNQSNLVISADSSTVLLDVYSDNFIIGTKGSGKSSLALQSLKLARQMKTNLFENQDASRKWYIQKNHEKKQTKVLVDYFTSLFNFDDKQLSYLDENTEKTEIVSENKLSRYNVNTSSLFSKIRELLYYCKDDVTAHTKEVIISHQDIIKVLSGDYSDFYRLVSDKSELTRDGCDNPGNWDIDDKKCEKYLTENLVSVCEKYELEIVDYPTS